MKTVGIYEAKTHLPRLVEEVEHGETVVITRHGKPVAKLGPIEEQKPPIEETIAAIREFRKGIRLGDDITIRELIEEGRRY